MKEHSTGSLNNGYISITEQPACEMSEKLSVCSSCEPVVANPSRAEHRETTGACTNRHIDKTEYRHIDKTEYKHVDKTEYRHIDKRECREFIGQNADTLMRQNAES